MVDKISNRLDWDKLRVFHAVAEAGSFTHASETLNLSQSAVSRQISGLEEELNVQLFHRHARGLLLTEQGETLFATVHDVFAKLTNVEGRIRDSKANPVGPLAVTTTVAFGSVWLTGRLQSFMDAYPEIDLTLLLNDSELDLGMRQADVAIRFNEPTQPDLIKRHLGTSSAHLYGSKSYLKAKREPKTVEDLRSHDMIAFGQNTDLPTTVTNWYFDHLEPHIGRIQPVLRVNNLYGMYRAVTAGIGLAALPQYFEVNPDLQRVLPELGDPQTDMYFVYPEELRNSARVTVFRDWLMAELAASAAQFT